MPLTEQQWQDCENKVLCGLPITLKIDGRRVTFDRRRYKDLRFCLVVFINGTLKFSWHFDQTEEAEDIRKRFFRKYRKHLFSKKVVRLRKRAGIDDPDPIYTCYSHAWFSFKSLKNHLLKNNESIELITGEVP